MPFDLSTAKPVEDSGGFDLSSAKPVYDEPQPAKPKPKPKREVDIPGMTGMMVGGVESAAQAGSSMFGSAVGGLAGLGQGVVSLVKGKPTAKAAEEAANRSEQVAGALTYEPKTKKGKMISHVASLPMEVAKSLAGKVGEVDAEHVGVSPAAGRTLGETAVEVATVLYGGRGALRGAEPKPPIPGKDFTPLRNFSPEQEERYRSMKSMGVDPTLGSVTRDPAQIRFEQQKSLETHTPSGAALNQRFAEQDTALSNAVTGMKKGDTGVNEAATGRSVRGALERKSASKKQDVDDLYETARESGETKEMVDVTPLVKYLKDNKPAAVAVQELSAVRAGLKKLLGEEEEAAPKETPAGKGKISSKIKIKAEEKPKEAPKVSIDDLEYLRQMAGRLGQKDGSASSYMREVRIIIDKVTDGVGGDRYKAARSLRKKYGDEFEEQRGVANVVEKPTRTDYKVADEDIWRKTVVNGSEHDLSTVIDSLKKSDTREQAAVSKQALIDLQNQTIQHLWEQATKASKDGRVVFSPGAFKQAVMNIGEAKLRMLLGPEALQHIRKVLRNAEDSKTNSVRAPGSDTRPNQEVMRTFADRHAGRLLAHALPTGLRWAGRVVDHLRDNSAEKARARAQDQAVSDALNPTRESAVEIQKLAKDVKSNRRRYMMSEGVKRSVPFTMATQNEAVDR